MTSYDRWLVKARLEWAAVRRPVTLVQFPQNTNNTVGRIGI